jgi:molybdopterin-guanine dinucleotide biosynthesis protein A
MTQAGTSGDSGSRGGFVLVGGHSTRMGRDKALLEFQGSTLAGRVAECVRRVAGNVTLIGPPDRYRELGYTVIPDRIPGCGPLGGVYTALSASHAEWNLMVACDMPLVTTQLFEALFTDVFSDAESGPSTVDCVIPELVARGPERVTTGSEFTTTGEGSRLDPLCAVYHRRCATAARRAIDRKIFKMHDFVSTLRIRKHPVAEPALLSNINTPPEWSSL